MLHELSERVFLDLANVAREYPYTDGHGIDMTCLVRRNLHPRSTPLPSGSGLPIRGIFVPGFLEITSGGEFPGVLRAQLTDGELTFFNQTQVMTKDGSWSPKHPDLFPAIFEQLAISWFNTLQLPIDHVHVDLEPDTKPALELEQALTKVKEPSQAVRLISTSKRMEKIGFTFPPTGIIYMHNRGGVQVRELIYQRA
jgi:hypothetical protein